ncbi:ABC transporter substrate-binding protein [Halorientalis pallida]|uniref:ABC transporter substrate-binding protein n=1 Tax=Halorientalis pallida TaxID=2479928 RepID=UPI003C6EEF5B
MPRTDGRQRVNRRRVLASASAALGGAVAGCSDLMGAGGGGTPTESKGSYEACIVPSGCVSFEEVPETWMVYNGGWADMAFALGQRDGFLTAGNMIPGFFFEPFGLDVPPQDELTAFANWDAGGWDKEVFYELDPDVILMDPNYLHGTGWDDDWDEDDTEEIAENVAPLFGNNCRRRRKFHDYKLYSLYGAFEKLATLFQERERYEAFATLHDEVQSEIQSRLPPESERPEVGLVNGGSEPAKGKFYPLHTQGEGYEMKPYRDLDVASAFPAEMEEQGTTDYEGLLDVDPEIILVHWGIGTTGDTSSFSASAFREQYVDPMATDSVGSELTAVQERNVYPGPYGEQGPIVNLLQTEMLAQQLYPDEFGEFDPERFPEVPAENQLFDRQRVRDIVDGV